MCVSKLCVSKLSVSKLCGQSCVWSKLYVSTVASCACASCV